MSREEDPGAARERTALAWQRTAISLLGASAVVCRLAASDLGWLAAVCAALAVPLAGGTLVEARRRYHRRLRGALPGGRAPTLLAVATAVVLLTELVAIVAR